MTTTTFTPTATTTIHAYTVADGPRLSDHHASAIRVDHADLHAVDGTPRFVITQGPRQIRTDGQFPHYTWTDGRDRQSTCITIDDPDLTDRETAFANDLIAATINADPANPHMYAPATGDEVAQARRFLIFHNLPATYGAISEEVTNGRAEAHADRIADSA